MNESVNESETISESGNAQPPKRGNKKVFIIVGIVLATALLVGGGVFAWNGYQGAQAAEREDERIGELRTATREIDSTLDDVWDLLDASDRDWDETPDEAGSTELPSLISSTLTTIEQAQTKTAEIRVSAKSLSDEEVSSAYVEVCDELDRVLEESKAELESMEEVAAQVTNAYDLEDDIAVGLDKLEKSTELGNSGEYREAETVANEAEKLFAGASTGYTEINEIIEDPGLPDYIAWLNECAELARMQATLALYGRTKGTATFNRQVDATNDKADEVWAMAGSYYEADFGYDSAKATGGDLVYLCRGAETRFDLAQEMTLEALGE